MANFKKLSRDFYTRPQTLRIARELLGKLLVVPLADGTRVSGMIVETEAYQGARDKASHAYGNRRTNRTESMFGVGGTAYVYFIYGMYYQFNVVTHQQDTPHAILIRALEPVEGASEMHARRPVKRDRDLTNGPGKLCLAMGIDRSYDRESLLGERVWLEEHETFGPRRIQSGPRVGIDYAAEYATKPWRFWLKDNIYVSRF
ncbi:MAG: DNA-3-methyladenine glycosylase [Acidobacteria bacterium]|nr:DNA-3-methyladenine glycosylase [Acidobacteriota bacterium]